MTDIRVFQRNQIGGCVTVISTEYKGDIHRIMIDYGSFLPGSGKEKDFQYPWDEEPVDAVFFTHYHGDHVGRLMEIPENVPLYMGVTARQVMINIQDALGKSEHVQDAALHRAEAALLKDDSRVHVFRWGERTYEHITLPGFTIEPYSVDHSAYDAYMFLIEAEDADSPDGRYRILHTGDFRGHGRRGKVMLRVIYKYVRDYGKRRVDALVIEGTMMSRPGEKVLTEPQMQREASKFLKEHKWAFLVCSSTNLDSLASFYQAAQSTNLRYGRYMYVYNDYFREQLKLFTETAGDWAEVYRFDKVALLPAFDFVPPGQRLDSPLSQGEMMEQFGFLAVIKPEDYQEAYIDRFVEAYREDRIKKMPVLIWSMWDGYLQEEYTGKDGKKYPNRAKNDKWISFIKRQEAKGIHVEHLHTSGHATPEMIAAVINAVDPQDRIYPMHTECAEAFRELPIREELKERIV